jgi:hypothetical protein
MALKVTLCYTFLLLLSISSAEDVKLRVKGVTNIATTDENFICATLDWWPENKCDYNQCPWGKAGILNLVIIKFQEPCIFSLYFDFLSKVYIKCYQNYY